MNILGGRFGSESLSVLRKPTIRPSGPWGCIEPIETSFESSLTLRSVHHGCRWCHILPPVREDLCTPQYLHQRKIHWQLRLLFQFWFSTNRLEESEGWYSQCCVVSDRLTKVTASSSYGVFHSCLHNWFVNFMFAMILENFATHWLRKEESWSWQAMRGWFPCANGWQTVEFGTSASPNRTWSKMCISVLQK